MFSNCPSILTENYLRSNLSVHLSILPFIIRSLSGAWIAISMEPSSMLVLSGPSSTLVLQGYKERDLPDKCEKLWFWESLVQGHVIVRIRQEETKTNSQGDTSLFGSAQKSSLCNSHPSPQFPFPNVHIVQFRSGRKKIDGETHFFFLVHHHASLRILLVPKPVPALQEAINK